MGYAAARLAGRQCAGFGAIGTLIRPAAACRYAVLDETWTNLGPYNHGGRARVLRFHPGNPSIMYVGSVSGGIFKSTDAGENWFPMTEQPAQSGRRLL